MICSREAMKDAGRWHCSECDDSFMRVETHCGHSLHVALRFPCQLGMSSLQQNEMNRHHNKDEGKQ